MSEEGEGTEEAREVVMSEKEVNTPYSSGEVIMESFGISEEEVNMNTPVTAYYNLTSSSSSTNLLQQVSNPDGKISVAIENDGIEANKYGAT